MRGRRFKAIIEQQAAGDDFVEGGQGAWKKVADAYVDIQPLRGREAAEAAAVAPLVTHKLETEFNPAVTSGMRVSVSGRIFHVESAINVREANRSLELLCIERGQ
jgi:SPP1 family predicted phage head-tail adaptor